MPMVEVDETQLGSLQNTAKTLQAMLSNPKHRRKILEAYKEVVPNASVPELEAVAPVEEKITGIEKTVTDFIKEFRDERDKERTEAKLAEIKAKVEAGHQTLRERGYTDDGIKQLDEFRDRKGLVDYEDAIRLFELDHPPPQVSEPSNPMNLFAMAQNEDGQDDFHKRLWESQGEDSSAVDRAARAAISELRGAAPRR